MPNKKMVSYIITGAVTLGILGASIIPTFAATEAQLDNSAKKKYKFEQNLNEETKAKVKSIMDDAKSQLKTLGVEMPERGSKAGLFEKLDEASKEKVKLIMENKRSGKITHEEAHTQLKALGIEMPKKGPRIDPFANLDANTKAKAQKIMENAREEISKLGVDFPLKGGHLHQNDKSVVQ
ncbi:MAG: hypothetical protein K0S51_2511 [Bacillales bacterium]|jgi:hypothetical protein|nr:hypothetical protein [Bacillales bacterium]